MSARVPPHDLAAEAAVVSSVLLSQAALDEVREGLAPEHCYADAHKLILRAAYAVDDANEPVDLVTVAARLRDAGELERVGGMAYMAELSDATPAVANVAAHARVVRDLARVRHVIATTQRIAAEGYCEIPDIDRWCEQAETDVFAAVQGGSNEDASEDADDLMHRLVRELHERRQSGVAPGIPTGFRDLDRRIGNLHTYLYIVAARPGMGKSALAQNILVSIAKGGGAGVYLSAEMLRAQIGMRMLAAEARVTGDRIRTGNMTAGHYAEVVRAAEELRKLPFAIAWKPGATISAIRSIARKKFAELKRKFGADPGVLVIDYLQLLDDQRQKGQTRDEALGVMTRALVKLAGDLGVPVILLSQLNREVEKRQNKKPQLSDLRESGNIEQDAHAVLFIYRDDYYDPESADRGVADIIVGKDRDNGPGWVKLKFTGEYTRFDTLASDEYEFDDFREVGDGA